MSRICNILTVTKWVTLTWYACVFWYDAGQSIVWFWKWWSWRIVFLYWWTSDYCTSGKKVYINLWIFVVVILSFLLCTFVFYIGSAKVALPVCSWCTMWAFWLGKDCDFVLYITDTALWCISYNDVLYDILFRLYQPAVAISKVHYFESQG